MSMVDQSVEAITSRHRLVPTAIPHLAMQLLIGSD